MPEKRWKSFSDLRLEGRVRSKAKRLVTISKDHPWALTCTLSPETCYAWSNSRTPKQKNEPEKRDPCPASQPDLSSVSLTKRPAPPERGSSWAQMVAVGADAEKAWNTHTGFAADPKGVGAIKLPCAPEECEEISPGKRKSQPTGILLSWCWDLPQWKWRGLHGWKPVKNLMFQ